jgi:hypothetical protein
MWSDAQLLLLIAALLYLSECVVWLPPQSVLLRDAGRGRWRRARRALETGGAGRGFAFLPPWPWSVRSVLATPPAFSASPDHATGFVAAQNGPIARPVQPDTLLPLAEAGGVRTLLREIRNGREVFARAADDATAEAGAALLRELAGKHDRKAREALLKKRVAESLDPEQVRRRVEEVGRAARPVELLCRLVFVWLFAVAPAACLYFGTERVLLPFFLATPILHLPLAVLFFRAHRRLCPLRRGDAWIELVKCVLSPPMAARSAELLWLHSFEGFHPMALLLAAGDPGDLPADARLELTDLRYPAFPGDIPESARACEAWHRGLLLAELSKRLEAANLPSATLEQGRPADLADRQPWCPRCREAMGSEEAACPACGTAPVRD